MKVLVYITCLTIQFLLGAFPFNPLYSLFCIPLFRSRPIPLLRYLNNSREENAPTASKKFGGKKRDQSNFQAGCLNAAEYMVVGYR